MLVVAGYKAEAFAAVKRAGCTELLNLLRHVIFRDAARSHVLLNPHKQFHESHAIALHSLTRALDLHIVFHCLQQCYRRLRIDRAAIEQAAGNRVARLVGVKKHCGVLDFLKKFLHTVVRCNLYTTLIEIRTHIGIDFALIHEKHVNSVRQIGIRYCHRIEFNV